MQAISLDFLGVPGSEVASKTADLIEQHGFPQDKRLGAGVVDGRSVWADGDTPATFVAALQAKVHPTSLPSHQANNFNGAATTTEIKLLRKVWNLALDWKASLLNDKQTGVSGGVQRSQCCEW